MAVKAASAGDLQEVALPDPGQRPWRVSGILFDRHDPPADAATIIAACAALLARHLESLTDWTTASWRIGDNNQYRVATTLEGGFELVVTLVSEPLEDVQWRLAGSGPAGSMVFDRGHREQLQRFGFGPAGDGSNWERDLRLVSARDAAIAARDLLALLTEVFGFCGQAPLSFTLAHGQRAEPGLLYRSDRKSVV